jgi:PTH2 family peptidyl-tRNA hydrolase
MSEVKQLIVVRNDLRSKLRHGKLAAQVAHASLAALIHDHDIDENCFGDGNLMMLDLDTAMEEWLTGSFTKAVLKCDDEAHILRLRNICEGADLRHYLIRDSGRTVFKEPTYTCLGIGPFYSDQLDKLFGDLKLY